jgi:hypothetical protein
LKNKDLYQSIPEQGLNGKRLCRAPNLGTGGELSGAIWVFKERWRNGSRAVSSCGLKVRLWRRAQFCLGQSDFIFADGAWDVCEGDHSLDVMNP